MSMNNLLVTGNPGVGKTTLIKKMITESRLNPRGFYSEEIRIGIERKGFKVKTFTGNEGILAHVDYKNKPRVGKYGIDVESFEAIIIPEIKEALQGSELIVIDEIGKMELFSERFKELVVKALNGSAPVLGAISERGNGFIKKIKERQDIRIYSITFKNRDSVYLEILNDFERLQREK
jgi:nucleoside-triphosphatase